MNSLERNINNLNKEQRLAVETIEGPVLIVAGPGTGKTQVLTLRIANILQSADVNPSNILCLTFTESGVTAMRERLLRLIGTPAYQVKIHTFHSFCNEAIQAFPEKFAFARELVQLDDLTRLKIIKEVIDSFDIEEKMILKPFHDKYFYKSAILNSIQTLKREGITFEKFEMITRDELAEIENNPELNKRTNKPTQKWSTKLKNAQKNIELSKIYTKYQEALTEKGLYDYEDMLLFVIEKFKVDEELLANYQERYLYILVDEYQDTNGAQNEILKYLGSFDKSPNIFAVGDDDQAIYRFQGANLENLLFFERQFENVKTILITTNYRSSQNVLDLAGSVIENNESRLTSVIPGLNKKLKAGVDIAKYPAEVYEFSTNEIENNFIAKKIKELHRNGANYSDIAIFYRKHSDAEDIVDTLLKAAIPIKLAAGRNALEEPIVQQFLDLIRLIQFKEINIEKLLFKVLFYEFLGFKRLDIFKITNFSHRKELFHNPENEKYSIMDIISSKELLEKAKVEDIEAIYNFSEKVVEWKTQSENLALVRFVELIGAESGFVDFIFRGKVDMENINSVNSMYQYIKELNKNNKKLTLDEFLNDVALLEENRIAVYEKELDTNADSVNMMTAHKSKGLEYKYVFIIKAYNGNWGGNKKGDLIKLPSFAEEVDKKLGDLINYDMEDERRLFYVALTRAKERIFITYAKEYPSGNSTKQVSQSQFVGELDKKLVEFKDTSEFEKADIESIRQAISPRVGSPYTITENDFLNGVIKDFRMSASALNEYIECPLKFKYSRLLKVPKLYDKNLSLGTAIHSGLESFFRELQKENEKDLGYILFTFEKALERQLLSKADYEETLIEGKEILKNYYEFYKEKLVKPLQVEYGFYGRDIILESEQTDPIALTGQIDKLEPLEKLGEVQHVKVVDYKTSTPKSSNEIMGLTKNSTGSIYRQLVFYKVLSEVDNQFRPFPTAPKYQIDLVEADFLKPDKVKKELKKISFEIPQEHVDELKLKIIDVMKRIRNLEFNGSEEYPLCGECEWCKM